MNNTIKKILVILLPLCPKSWKDLVFHGYMKGTDFDAVLCFHEENRKGFISAFELVQKNLLPSSGVYDAYSEISKLCRETAAELPEEDRWNGITITCDCNFHFKIAYEYEAENQSLTSEWVQKYLK